MLTKYNLKMPREIFSGEDALENLKTILLANGVKKPPSLRIRASRAPACWTSPWTGSGPPG